MKAEIHSLFPTPVYFTKINRKFSKQENDYFNKPTKVKNIGNLTSKDKYVLDKKPFIKLKKELLDIVKNYYQQIICTSNDIEPTITQSWLIIQIKKNIIIFILILILTYQEYYTLMQIRKMIKSTFLDKGMNPLNQLLKVIMFLMQKVGGFQLRLTKLFYFLLI